MNKKTAEVLVAYTLPEVWRAVQRRRIENQAADKRDAKYIAFLLTQRRDGKSKKLPSAITHYAKVKDTRIIHVDHSYFEREMPEVLKVAQSKRWDKSGSNKEYKLEWIKELGHSMLHQKGMFAKGRVCFYTTLEELKNTKYKYIQEIKTERQLDANTISKKDNKNR